MRFLTFGIVALVATMIPGWALAHCPLCTIGAGVLAIVAASLGFSSAAVGLLIGAFALAMGIWVARLIQKKWFLYQDGVIVALVYLTTVIPLMPLAREYKPLYVSLFGEYGTVFHTTYTIDLYLLGAILGGLVVGAVPAVSRIITRGIGSSVPFQRMIVTAGLLVISITVMEFLIGRLV